MAKEAKKSRGQPTKYKPEYCKEIIEFFDIEHFNIITETTTYKNGNKTEREVRVPAQLPFFSAFAREIEVTTETLNQWTKKYPDFSDAYKRAKELQKEMLINNGLMGLYNASSYIFTAKNIAGMRDNPAHEEEIEKILSGLTAEIALGQLAKVKELGLSGLDMRSAEGNNGNNSH